MPRLVTLSGVAGDGFETFLERKHPGAFADEHHVPRFFHDAASRGNGMAYALEAGDASSFMARAAHDAGIKLDHTRRIGSAT